METKFRTATWNSVGYDASKARSLDEALEVSKLDYEVVKMPLIVKGTGIRLDNRFVTARPDDSLPGGLRTYDVVSDKFEVIQNREAFDFVNYMGSDVRFVKAGETHSGMVYIIGALPEVVILGDKFTPYVIFRNGFSGKVKITAAICPLRIICQNQFNFSFSNVQNAITVRHVSNAEAKLEEAREVLKLSSDYMTTLTEVAKQFAKVKFSPADIEFVTNSLFPIPKDVTGMDAFKLARLQEQRERFKAAHNAEDNQNFKNTAWGMVNAYTDFITHTPAMGKTGTKEENKFISTVFHPAAVNRILELVGFRAGIEV